MLVTPWGDSGVKNLGDGSGEGGSGCVLVAGQWIGYRRSLKDGRLLSKDTSEADGVDLETNIVKNSRASAVN